MKKILILLLLLVSTNVFAEWTAVDSASGMTAYADFGTIKRKGNKVKMWSLFDYKTVQEGAGHRFLSMMTRDEYDYEEETSQVI